MTDSSTGPGKTAQTKTTGGDAVVITCAITGAIHTPTMSPYLPITADEIAREAIAAAEAGAAILHLHARDEVTGKPDQTPEAFARFLPRIKQQTNAAINITTGGSPYMRVEERVLPAATFKPEVASLNMGSINFGLYHLVPKYETFKFDWEKPHLEATKDLVFRNSFKDIEYILETCYGNGTRFEFECYDIAHLYNLAHFADRGLVKAPFFVQSVFGLLGGIGPHPEDVAHMKRTADRLFGDSYRWSVLGAGSAQLRIAAQAAALGGNIRVGLEDSLWAGKGKLATSNAEQVALARKIIEGLGKRVATPDEAREILSLKGGDNVAF
ncbi:3-keto-5-aminohexanoate cleavage protein [Pseudoxanthobacter sp. M-2]|uniref:3-keto-5-aminohexanoate cleavage protein n=1 Tax=Pseudoxanthobacter sp. M-2 TaxID=3078754 RepID=UPI0038FCDB0A